MKLNIFELSLCFISFIPAEENIPAANDEASGPTAEEEIGEGRNNGEEGGISSENPNAGKYMVLLFRLF